MAPSIDIVSNGHKPQSNESMSMDIATALRGTTILVTGAAGFVGVALVQRLLCDPTLSSIKRVICIIRGKTIEAATARLPVSLQALAAKSDDQSFPRLVVLNGDCGKPDFGLSEDLLRVAMQAEIVIHAAGDTKFTLSHKEAMGSITDLAYMTSRFSLLSYRVKTHIHISTTFVAWFMPDGSIVKENLIQQGLSNDDQHENHVNTYFHAKTIAEGCVNAIWVPQIGRALHGKSCRILRLSTIGPSLSFPKPAWGAGHPSSPLCAAIAAVQLKDMSAFADGAFLDVIPVDIAVNQIVAITAATHRTQSLPADHISHPRNRLNPVNQDGRNVPVYNIATGLSGPHNIQLRTLNDPELSLAEPYIPEKNLMKVYRPFVVKKLDFSTTRAAKVMQIDASPDSASIESATNYLENLHLNGQLIAAKKQEVNSNGSSNGQTSTVTTRNLAEDWSDPPISCGDLQVDVGKSVSIAQHIEKQDPQAAWRAYITLIRDEMERRGPRAEWTSFVD